VLIASFCFFFAEPISLPSFLFLTLLTGVLGPPIACETTDSFSLLTESSSRAEVFWPSSSDAALTSCDPEISSQRINEQNYHQKPNGLWDLPLPVALPYPSDS